MWYARCSIFWMIILLYTQWKCLNQSCKSIMRTTKSEEEEEKFYSHKTIDCKMDLQISMCARCVFGQDFNSSFQYRCLLCLIVVFFLIDSIHNIHWKEKKTEKRPKLKPPHNRIVFIFFIMHIFNKFEFYAHLISWFKWLELEFSRNTGCQPNGNGNGITTCSVYLKTMHSVPFFFINLQK